MGCKVLCKLTRIVVNSLLLIHGPFISFTKFLGSCIKQAVSLQPVSPLLSRPTQHLTCLQPVNILALKKMVCVTSCAVEWLIAKDASLFPPFPSKKEKKRKKNKERSCSESLTHVRVSNRLLKRGKVSKESIQTKYSSSTSLICFNKKEADSLAI